MIGSTSGTTRVVATPAEGALWTAVQNLVAADYDLCGEFSASPDGRRIVYVAARRGRGEGLRLLVVERVPGAGADTSLNSYEVAIHDTLDETIPARDISCPQCSHRLPTWSAVCPDCGRGTAPTAVTRGEWSLANTQSAVAAVLGGDCTPLGELPTAAGSVVAVMRDDRSGDVVALAFERTGGRDGATRAVPVGRLQRPTEPAVRRPSSPHSGEIGPLPASERALVAAGDASATRLADDPSAVDLPIVCPKCRSRYEADVQRCPVDGEPLSKPTDGSDLIGRVLGGKFRVLRLLGEGGMGRVYLAEHVRIGRRCALKVLSPTLVGHPDSIRRFDGEARNASRIVHPNVAIVYDFEETPDGLVYIVLEFIDGETLGAILAREVWLDVPRAVRIARDTADALQAAHDLGIVHRDLKPDNIMIARTATGDDLVKVVDFGIAKAVEDAGADTRVTRTGFVVGTPRYMSPEQLAGEAVDARSDVYALGCVLYEAITGRPAHAAATTTKRVLRQPRLREDAPRSLDAIITRAMSRASPERYQTAREMRDALDVLLGAIERRQNAMRRSIALRIGVGVVAAATIAAAAWTFVGRRSAPPPPDAVAGSVGVASTPRVAPTAAELSAVPARTPGTVVPAPPVASAKGPALHPAASAPRTTSEVERYLSSVETVVRSAWHDALQGITPRGSERATFALLIGPDGRVVHITPVNLSNVPAYDDALGVAVQTIATFGPPPAALIGGRTAVPLKAVFQGSDVIVHLADRERPGAPPSTTPDH